MPQHVTNNTYLAGHACFSYALPYRSYTIKGRLCPPYVQGSAHTGWPWFKMTSTFLYLTSSTLP